MKTVLFCLLLLLSSCQYKHFDFDAVYHYKIDISGDALNKFLSKTNKTPDEAILEVILTENEPYKIDPEVVKNIERLYPIQKKLNSTEAEKINAIYYDGYNFTRSRCVPVYRDILLFKKNDSVVGISKICFDCDMQYNIDIYGNEKEFDNTNFTVLQQILK